MKQPPSSFYMSRSHYDSNAGNMTYVYECNTCHNNTLVAGSSGTPRRCTSCDIEFEKLKTKCVRRLFLSTL